MARSVLLTDDDDTLRQLLRMVLGRSDGFEVVGEAGDARTCLDQARTLAPDVVLLDIGLPGRSGLEVLPELREVAPRALVLVLSAHSADRMERQAVEAGAHAYLPKDDLVRGLIPALQEALRRREDLVAHVTAGPLVVAPPLDRFAAAAAHDLRRSLLGVTAHADLLARAPAVVEDTESTGLLRDLRASARAGLALVDDLQAYADVLSRPDLAEPIDLTRLVQDLLRRWPEADVEVVDLGTAVADPVLLRHLMGQLLDNAVRYHRSGQPAQVSVRRSTDTAALLVEDTGAGIATAERARVLQEFERGAAPGLPPGTGLGLAICRLIAQRYGGGLSLLEGRTGGTRVEVSLPRASLSGPPAGAPLG